jgi:hypothetical protein
MSHSASFCPCLRHLNLNQLTQTDPTVAVRALLHLSGLEGLSLWSGGITGQAIAQIQPGSWPKLRVLNCSNNNFMDDPVQ